MSSLQRRSPAVALVLAALAAGGLVVAWLGRDDGRRARRSGGAAGGIATVTRQTLVDRESVSGVLGYSDTRTVLHRLSSGSDDRAADGGQGDSGRRAGDGGDEDGQGDGRAAGGSGTLTRVARPASVVRRGGVLYEVDGQPVVLMYGSTPAYRTLRTGVDGGRDVRQLEQNLAALGFAPGTVDDDFTSTTASAVRAWQAARDLEETGVVDLGRVAFLPGPRRVGARKASIGQALGAGQEVLETTSTRRVVKIELDVGLQSLVRRGAAVDVTLPGGRSVPGRITRVGRVAREKDVGGGAGDAGTEDQELVIDVTVRLRSRKGIGRLDQAPVGVGIARESKENALTVPVNALLARRGGGYAVELAGSGRFAAVEAGLFADGLVEISGAQIRAGMRVVVPE